jgi:hypothetical protein
MKVDAGSCGSAIDCGNCQHFLKDTIYDTDVEVNVFVQVNTERTCASSVSRLFLLAPILASVQIGSHDSGAALAQP